MNMMSPRQDKDLTIISLLPNLVTITAICAGLSAIRFGYRGNFELAVDLILLAALLDGIDGRLARLLKSESRIGGELDTLADFLNFGVAPALVLYQWALIETIPSRGWVAVLVYAVACVLRLARFNVTSKSESELGCKGHFIGVPAPAGALLVLLPMFVSFAFGSAEYGGANIPLIPPGLIALYMFGIAFLLISRIPTPSLKQARVSRAGAKYVMVGFAFAGAMILAEPWISLTVLALGYVGLVIFSLLRGRGKAAGSGPDNREQSNGN